MFTNAKLHDKIVEENNGKFQLQYDRHKVCVDRDNDPSIVIKTKKGYIVSEIKYSLNKPFKRQQSDTEYFKLTYSFKLITPHFEIYQENISKMNLLLPDLEKPGEYRVIYTANAIFEVDDLKDVVFIFYRDSQPFEAWNFYFFDASIFHGSDLLFTIKNVFREVDTNNGFRLGQIQYRRLKGAIEKRETENCIMLNGREVSEKDLNLSFISWEEKFGYHKNSYYKLSNMYSIDNRLSVTDKRLKWDSQELVKWKCVFGHEWTESIVNYTQPKGQRFLCPICESIIVGIRVFNPDSIIKRNIEKIKCLCNLYNTNNLEYLYDYINADCVELESRIKKRKGESLWMDGCNGSDNIEFRFLYPDGKHGDITMMIAKKGELTEIGIDEYKCLLSTTNIKDIDVLTGFYSNAVFDDNYSHDAISKTVFKHHMMYKYIVLTEVRELFTRRLYNRDQINTPVLSDYIKEYREGVKALSENYYALAVENGVATRKWVSEQKLYRVVKKKYPSAIFQYHDDWLGLQSLDVYIPSLRVGIEYQGQQHFIPVDFFGGEDQFQEGQERDEKKRKLCKENGVTLIEWRYDTPLTEEKVYSEIEKLV